MLESWERGKEINRERTNPMNESEGTPANENELVRCYVPRSYSFSGRDSLASVLRPVPVTPPAPGTARHTGDLANVCEERACKHRGGWCKQEVHGNKMTEAEVKGGPRFSGQVQMKIKQRKQDRSYERESTSKRKSIKGVHPQWKRTIDL